MPAENIGILRLVAEGERHDGSGTPDWIDRLALVVYDPAKDQYLTFFSGGYELVPMLDWLSDNEMHLRSTLPLITQRAGESLSETFDRARDVLDDVEDNDDAFDLVADALYQYNSHHNLSFGAPGTPMPNVFIGRTDLGHEVSALELENQPGRKLAYLFDIDDFYENLPPADYGSTDKQSGG